MTHLKSFLNIHKGERSFSFFMFAYFFLTIVSFWILKPIKKTLFIRFYDQSGLDFFGTHLNAAQVELTAKITNMFVAFAAMLIFAFLSRYWRKEKLSIAFVTFLGACELALSILIREPNAFAVWGLYLFGDLFITVMMACFFAFLNDSVSTEMMKRLYGTILLGGVIGGVVGTTFVNLSIKKVPPEHALLVCVGLALLIAVSAFLARKYAPKAKAENVAVSEAPKTTIFSGLQTVASSRYLLAVLGLVVCYEMLSLILDFQWTSSFGHYLDGPEIGQHISTVYAISNLCSVFVQFFLTGWIFQRWGLNKGLMVLPSTILAVSCAFLILPILWIGAALSIFDNSINYSLHQSAREGLYVPLTSREKYEAKSFIDIFGMRTAKVISVVALLLISAVFKEFSAVRWLSLVTIPLSIAFVTLAYYLGKEYKRITS